jgi:hypothetical protein
MSDTLADSVTAIGDDSLTLAEEIKRFKTVELISFLQEQDLELDEEDLEIIREQKVNGRDFLKVTEEKLRSYDMKGGPASRLVDFAKECKKKKLKAFSSYNTKKDLSEVLRKYGIDGNGIETIDQFPPREYYICDPEVLYAY